MQPGTVLETSNVNPSIAERSEHNKGPSKKAKRAKIRSPQEGQEANNRPDADQKRKRHKACVLCSKAHKACDSARPCSRCIASGKEDQCRDVARTKKRKTPISQRKIFFHTFNDGMSERSLVEVLPISNRKFNSLSLL